MPPFRVATFNLCQFCAPGSYWYRRGESSCYTPEMWEEKRAFILQMLAEMDADIVGFQEVFSPDALRALLAEAGYAHVAIPDTPLRAEDDAAVYRAPVNAIASRHPIEKAGLLAPEPHLWSTGLLAPDFHYRRGLVDADIAVPGLDRPLNVLVCHLKSPGATVDDTAVAKHPAWRDRFRSYLHQRAVLDAAQAIHRTGEAMMLYTTVMHRIARDPGLPVIVMGDLNDTPDSLPLRVLTQAAPIDEIAGTPWEALPDAARAEARHWQLRSTEKLVRPDATETAPSLTGEGYRETVDFILVSGALAGDTPDTQARVTAHRVHDAHFTRPGPPHRSSDHAPVSATLECRMKP